MTLGPGPRVKGNDWSVLDPPVLGSYVPSRTVSVVIPAYRAQDTLPYTLAALEAQSYPPHLLEVVVVDDDDDTPRLELPACRPERTRVVDAGSSWGPANARAAGAAVAEGEVLHWLDADMVPDRDHVAQQMRWHHVLDHAVVLGHKQFVDRAPLPPVDEVHQAVADGRLDEVLTQGWVEDHTWVEEIWSRTDDLKSAGFRAFHVHVGATASARRELYAAAGGMDTSLKLGEDVELGYRLAMRGAVFVAERGATSWHLGRSHLMRLESLVQRYNAPFVAQRVPDFRKFRQCQGRSYQVPYIEVVVPVAGHPWELVKYTVDGVLQAQPSDVRCVLVGPWSDLHDDRRQLLQDDALDLRLVREEYAADRRVVMAEVIEPTAFPAQFRLHLPVGWRPGAVTLERLTLEMQRRSQGLRSVILGEGQLARLERTAAFERARRIQAPDETIDDAVDAVSETWWSDGGEHGFECPAMPLGPPAEAGLELQVDRADLWEAAGTDPDTSTVEQVHPAIPERRRLSRLRPESFGHR
jgi:glycosyltransferase involved in cell wall biosynthesis